MKIILDWKPPMGNEIMKMQGKRRYKYASLRWQWRNRILSWGLTSDQEFYTFPPGTEIHMTRIYDGRKGKTVDHGNQVTGFKPCLDAMQDLGIISNDSRKFIKEFYYEEKARKDQIIIEIKSPEDDNLPD